MSDSTDTRHDLLTRIDANWSRLIEKLHSFSENEMHIPNVVGIWSLKDLLGHLETWDQIAVMKIDLAEEGDTRPWWQVVDTPYSDIDEFNEADADANRHKSIKQLWNELHARHAELRERVGTSEHATDDLVAVDTWEHYQVHLDDIDAWERRRRASASAKTD